MFRLKGRENPVVCGWIGTAVEVTGIPRPGSWHSSVITKSASQPSRQALRQLLSRAAMTSYCCVSHLSFTCWPFDKLTTPSSWKCFLTWCSALQALGFHLSCPLHWPVLISLAGSSFWLPNVPRLHPQAPLRSCLDVPFQCRSLNVTHTLMSPSLHS